MKSNNGKMILIPDRLSEPPDVEREAFGPGYEILTPCGTHTSEISDEIWGSTDAILAWHDLQFTEQVIKKLKVCKAIVRVGVGFDNVDLQAAGEYGIPVCNVPDYGTNDVADHAVALMLALFRGIYAFSEKVRDSETSWHWNSAGTLQRVEGAVLGIIGLGRIGTATAMRAKAFGMRIVFYDPYIPDGQDKALGLKRADSLPELLSQSDAVSFHTPLTEETRGMGNGAFFNELKEGTIVVNTARGPIIELDALYQALRTGRVKSAGLDVVEMEPPDPGHPLIQAWRNREEWIEHRLIITPHCAFFCEEAYREMRYKAALEAKRILNGKLPRNCVNRKWLKLA